MSRRPLSSLTVLAMFVSLLVPLTLAPAAAEVPADGAFFTATLSGDAEVPPVDTDAQGRAGLVYADGTLSYVVTTTGLEDTVMAHIHLGGPEVNGPVAAWLFGPVDGGVTRDGTLARGTVTDADVVDIAAADLPAGFEAFDGTVASLVPFLESGDAYVNVHTVANPAGEIRGQVDHLDVTDAFPDDNASRHEAAIDVVAAADIAHGRAGGRFAPDAPVTRGQMAALLARAFQLPAASSHPFTDVPGTTHEAAIAALYASGVTQGVTATTFAPHDPVSRAQMATFLVRALLLTEGGDLDVFVDVAGTVHRENINRLANSGITQGVTANRYGPGLAVKRAEMASFLARSFAWDRVDGPASFDLTLLHNNDGESDVLPDGDIGGVARFVTAVEQARAAADTDGVITVSSGDNFLAGLTFTASQEQGTYYDAVALEAIGYDAIALGNHDFDFGPDVLADFIAEFEEQPTYLSANLDFSAEPALEALVDAGTIAPSTVVDAGGTQVGIVGATTETLPTVSSPRDVIVNEVQPAVQAEIDALRADGVQIIVLISHLQSVNEDLALIPNLSGLDIAVAGGGDELLANADDTLREGDEEEIFGPYPLWAVSRDGYEVPVVTTPGQYSYLGRLIASFTAAGTLVDVDESSGPIAIIDQTPDPTVVAEVEEPVAAFVSELEQTVVATSDVALDARRNEVRTRETNFGDLIADSLLWAGRDFAAAEGLPEPDLAIQNGGGIRLDAILPAGDITVRDTVDTLPFLNYVTVVPDLSRATVKQLFENAVSNVENVDGRFAQVSEGVELVYDPSRTAQVVDETGAVVTAGQRVRSLTINGEAIVTNGSVVAGDPLTVATIDFLANGGDGYPFGGAELHVDTATTYQAALQGYLQASAAEGGLAGQVTAAAYPVGGEGRITAN